MSSFCVHIENVWGRQDIKISMVQDSKIVSKKKEAVESWPETEKEERISSGESLVSFGEYSLVYQRRDGQNAMFTQRSVM